MLSPKASSLAPVNELLAKDNNQYSPEDVRALCKHLQNRSADNHTDICFKLWTFGNRSQMVSEAICETICGGAAVLAGLIEEPPPNQRYQCGFSLKICVISVIGNCAQFPRNKVPLLEANWGAILAREVDDPEFVEGRAVCSLAIAFLLGSEEPAEGESSELVRVKPESIHPLVEGFISPDASFYGTESDHSELGGALRNLASADANKPTLGKYIPELLPCLQSEIHSGGRKPLLQMLWHLAFLESNQKLLQEHNVLEVIAAVDTNDDPAMIKCVAGLKFLLGQERQKRAKRRESTIKSSEELDSTTGHIMISYQWDNQPLIKALARRLQASGFKVWLDIDQMAGSTLEAMADAIDGSVLILMCVSGRYKESANCRLEAEYALSCKKSVIPLMMQSNYKASGWLGMLMGQKLWYDFTHGTCDVPEKVYQELMVGIGKAVEQKGLKAPLSPPAQAPPNANASAAFAPPAAVPVTNGRTYAKWSVSQVSKWLVSLELEQEVVDTFESERMAGSGLARIAKWENTNLDTTLQLLERLGMSKLGDVSNFLACLDALP